MVERQGIREEIEMDSAQRDSAEYYVVHMLLGVSQWRFAPVVTCGLEKSFSYEQKVTTIFKFEIKSGCMCEMTFKS
jgi:hypothetical protein